MRFAAYAFFACLLLLSGCVLYTEDDRGNRILMSDEEKLGISTMSVQPINEECDDSDPLPCRCMLCENKTPWAARLLPFLSRWLDSSLKGGKCNFSPCNAGTFVKNIMFHSDKIQNRVFMYGHGPSFSSTDSANLYCEYSLQLATKWMKGIGAPPKIPVPGRAMCWLERNVMPLYIYYTKGQYIDESRTRQIAKALNGAGPAILTTEVDFDSSNSEQVEAVKKQILAYQDCEECLTALALKSGDYHGLELFLEDPTIYPNGKNLSEMIDLVGFGFRANDYKTCDVEKIIGENYLFSRQILENYSKPSIWLYAGASQGKNVDGKCTFTAQKVHNFYQRLFSLAPALANSGVIGVSFYEFIDRTGPLPCNDVQNCEFGVMKPDGQKHPEINTWSRLCKYYGTEDVRNPIIYPRNGKSPLCDFAQNFKMFKEVSREVGVTEKGLEYEEVSPTEKREKFGCGEVCVSEFKVPKPDVYDNTGKQLDATAGIDPCIDFPIIDQLADDNDFSAMYMRAIISQESQFDRWVVSCNEVPCITPLGTTMSDICTSAGYGPDCPAHTLGGGKTCPSSKPYFCAYGLAQCIERPGDRSSATDGCRGEDDFYDPFNPAENVCCGINKMRTALESAEQFVNSVKDTLAECSGGYEEEEYGWLTHYLASLEYYIGGERAYKNHFGNFLAQRDDPDTGGKCSGEVDFVEYLKTIPCDKVKDCRKYPQQVLSRYIDAVDNQCDSDCPGK
ncbi:MAG: hypothetical protein N3E51_03265 [Candidatus Micrarchaeota archaeon]|nr:hypothetical protein [Candidatus Micrarchaeota archaeon]